PRASASGSLPLALSGEAGKAFSSEIDGGEIAQEIKRMLGDPHIAKTIHDYKSALRRLGARSLKLAGVHDDPMLYSYLINPTSSKHSRGEIAVRSFNLNLSGSVAEAADVTGRATAQLRREVEEDGLLPVYETIDLPLSPVLARMEDAGVKIDVETLGQLSVDLEKQSSATACEFYSASGKEFNINSPRQLGDVLFNKLNLPKPVKYGKGRTISTAVDVLESLSEEHEVPKLVLEYRQLSKLKSTYVDAL